jgi:hypothetical protein
MKTLLLENAREEPWLLETCEDWIGAVLVGRSICWDSANGKPGQNAGTPGVLLKSHCVEFRS